jgi:hypothetical protein
VVEGPHRLRYRPSASAFAAATSHGFATGRIIETIVDSKRHNPYCAIQIISDMSQNGTTKNGKQTLHH